MICRDNLKRVIFEEVFLNFKNLDFADDNLIFYISNMLTYFLRSDNMVDIRNFKLENMLLDETENLNSALILRKSADSILFNLGMFNPYFKKRNLIDIYTYIGKRLYKISSFYYPNLKETLLNISKNFEGCIYGLNYVGKKLNL